MSVAGGLVQAYGIQRESEAQARASEFNANTATQNAEQAILQAAQEERRVRTLGRKEVGTMVAGYGASGIVGGSSLDVLAESIANLELDALNVRYGGQVKATNFRNEATYERYRAKEARASGQIRAAATLLSSAAQTGQQLATSGAGG
jgi:hypothetical protein